MIFWNKCFKWHGDINCFKYTFPLTEGVDIFNNSFLLLLQTPTLASNCFLRNNVMGHSGAQQEWNEARNSILISQWIQAMVKHRIKMYFKHFSADFWPQPGVSKAVNNQTEWKQALKIWAIIPIKITIKQNTQAETKGNEKMPNRTDKSSSTSWRQLLRETDETLYGGNAIILLPWQKSLFHGSLPI